MSCEISIDEKENVVEWLCGLVGVLCSQNYGPGHLLSLQQWQMARPSVLVHEKLPFYSLAREELLPLLVRGWSAPWKGGGQPLFSLPGALDSALLALRLTKVSLQLESPSLSVLTGLLYFLATPSQSLIIFLRVEI